MEFDNSVAGQDGMIADTSHDIHNLTNGKGLSVIQELDEPS